MQISLLTIFVFSGMRNLIMVKLDCCIGTTRHHKQDLATEKKG